MELNHPKIPPNCPYFKEQNGWSYFIHYFPKGNLDAVGPLNGGCEVQESFRPIIASVAAVYWEKEKARLYSIPGEYSTYCMADQNIEAWLKWGGLK